MADALITEKPSNKMSTVIGIPMIIDTKSDWRYVSEFAKARISISSEFLLRTAPPKGIRQTAEDSKTTREVTTA